MHGFSCAVYWTRRWLDQSDESPMRGDKEVKLRDRGCDRGLVSRLRCMPAVTTTTCNRKVLWP